MANTNVDIDFDINTLWTDIPDGDDLSDIFGTNLAEEKKDEPAAEAPAKEEKPAAPVEETAPQAKEETTEELFSEVEEMAEAAINGTENTAGEAEKEQTTPTEEAAPVPEQAEETNSAEVAAQTESVEEAKTQEEATAEAPAAPAEEAPKVEAKAEKAPEGAEKAAAADEEPKVEVEVAKPKKTRRTRKTAAKPAVEGEIITAHSNEVDSNFIGSLLLVPGEEFLKEKGEIEKLMSEITLEPGMSDAVVDTMIAKNMLLLQHIAGIEYGYHVAYENLTNKDTGLIKRVQENAMLTCEGTEKDKKLAASVAVANYEYTKGHKVDLYQHANALRGAAYFVKRAAEFQKATSIALSMFRKNAA